MGFKNVEHAWHFGLDSRTPRLARDQTHFTNRSMPSETAQPRRLTERCRLRRQRDLPAGRAGFEFFADAQSRECQCAFEFRSVLVVRLNELRHPPPQVTHFEIQL